MSASAILDLDKVSIFDQDGIEDRVIPLLLGFLGGGVGFKVKSRRNYAGTIVD
jgi:hypothetical protein